MNRRASASTLDAAAEGGIDFLDTADVYPLGGNRTTSGRTAREIVGALAERANIASFARPRSAPGFRTGHVGNTFRGHRCGNTRSGWQTDYVDSIRLGGFRSEHSDPMRHWRPWIDRASPASRRYDVEFELDGASLAHGKHHQRGLQKLQLQHYNCLLRPPSSVTCFRFARKKAVRSFPTGQWAPSHGQAPSHRTAAKYQVLRQAPAEYVDRFGGGGQSSAIAPTAQLRTALWIKPAAGTTSSKARNENVARRSVGKRLGQTSKPAAGRVISATWSEPRLGFAAQQGLDLLL